jgi:hypothetical protein
MGVYSMAVSDLVAVADQIQKYWSPLFTKQLRESLLLGGLVDKKYEGAIARQGDTVRVSQVNAPNGQLLTIGVDADSFASEAISTTKVDIKADKRAVAAYEFQDLVELQSQISQSNPEVMEALRYAMAKQINDYLYSLVAPSTSAPDHDVSSVTDFNAAQLAAIRLLAAKAKWPDAPGWYLMLDPTYYSDLLNASTITSSDFGASDAPMIGGKIGLKRMGFNIFEDNSRGTDYGLAFHPDFLHMVSQTAVQVKISDLHAQKKFGLVMSVDLVFGARLGIDGNVKHIKIYNT